MNHHPEVLPWQALMHENRIVAQSPQDRAELVSRLQQSLRNVLG